MNYQDIPDLFKAAAINWVHDYAQSMGAALAFYTMYSHRFGSRKGQPLPVAAVFPAPMSNPLPTQEPAESTP